jgi:cytoskeletal protein CcmA (bactofilin family)
MTTTLIAKRTRVGGLIETEGDVVVEGRVEGTIRAGGCVTIGVSGVAVSDVEAGRAMVLGILIGNVTAFERIDVAASARIIGDVRAPAIVVATAGLVEGIIEEIQPGEGVKSTLQLRQNPLVRPARPSGSMPPVAPALPLLAPPPTQPPVQPPAATRPGSRVDTRAPTQPLRGQSVATSRPGRPPSPSPAPARAAPSSTPVTRRPGPPPTPAFHDDDGALPAAPAPTRGPLAQTQLAEPAPPPIPRPPSRVRLVTRDGIVDKP